MKRTPAVSPPLTTQEQIDRIQSLVQQLHSRSMQPMDGALAHSMEVAKRLDEHKRLTHEVLAAIRRNTEMHIKGLEQRITDLQNIKDAGVNRTIGAQLASMKEDISGLHKLHAAGHVRLERLSKRLTNQSKRRKRK